MGSGEDGIEEGWDEDFALSSGTEDDDGEEEPLQVIGVRADPANEETWDSDFDFSDDEGPATLGLAPQPVASVAAVRRGSFIGGPNGPAAMAAARRGSFIAGPTTAIARQTSFSADGAEGIEGGSGFGSGGDAGGSAWGQLVAGLEALLASLPQPPSSVKSRAAEESEDEDWELELAAPDVPMKLQKGNKDHMEEDVEEWEKDLVIEDSDTEDNGPVKETKKSSDQAKPPTSTPRGELGIDADDGELIIEDSDEEDGRANTAKEESKGSVNNTKQPDDKDDNWTTDLENLEAQLEEAQRNADRASELRLHRDIANLYKQRTQWQKALASLKLAHKIVTRHRTLLKDVEQTEVEILFEIGETARSNGDILEAEEHLHKALEACHKISNPQLLGRVQYQLGLSSMASHRPLRAAVFFSNQLKSLSPTQDWEGFAKGCLEIGKILKASGHVEISRGFLERATKYEAPSSITDEARTVLSSLPRVVPSVDSEEDSGEKDEADNESESESDWEAELNLSDNESAPLSRKLGLDLHGMDMEGEVSRVPPTEESVKGTLPPRYKLNTDDEQHVEIQKFPKPTFLYSLRTKEGESYLHERELVSWLETIATKHSLVHTDAPLSISSVEFCASIVGYPKFSEEWLRMYTDYCCTAYTHRKKDDCWQTLRHFFSSYDERKYSSSDMPLPQEVDSILILVHLASKLWTEEKEKEFAGFLKTTRKFLPQAATLLALIHAETHCHHGGGEKYGAVARLLEIYQRANAAAPTAPALVSHIYGGALDNSYLQAIALTDLQLHLNYMSPLTSLKLQGEEATDYPDLQTCTVNDYQSEGEIDDDVPVEGSEEDWWADEDGVEGAPADEGGERTLNMDVLENSDLRIKELQNLYQKLPAGWYKAKAAYALGTFYVGAAESAAGSAEETALGERLLFEAVYILDQCPTAMPGCEAIVSELGTNALLAYAAVLMRNYKYIYAIRAYHSALVCLHLRNKRDAYYSLLHQLAEVSRGHNDHPRSLDYLHQMLQKYTDENKINEILYVSDMLSKQYSEIGLYTHAEAHIQMASGHLESQGGGADARKLRVMIDAATLFLESGQLNRAIELLSYLILLHQLHIQELGREKYRGALMLLAEAYIKKRWFAEAQSVLDKLAKEPLHPFRATNDTAFDPGMRESSKYWHMKASNYLQGSLYGEALACVDLAIRACSKQSLGLLGRYYYLRGKILQEIIRNPPTMPTTLPAPNLDEDTIRYILYLGEKGRPTVEPTLYSCPGDVLQEAVSSLDRAYDYFLAVGDDLQLSKTLSRIAEIYLDYLFIHVALFRVPYEERARLTSFSLSEMARKPGAMEDEEEEGKDVFISFDTIEGPAETCLDICAETCNVMLMLTGYMNMAELRYLQDMIGDSLAFWRECKEQFLLLFMDGPRFMAENATPSLLGRALHLVKRLLRFMLCFDSELINKNLMLIDAYLMLERELEQSRKRSLNLRLPTDADANHALSQVMRLINTPSRSNLLDLRRKRYPSFTAREGAGNLVFDAVDGEEDKKSQHSSTNGNAQDSQAATAMMNGGGAWGKLRWIKNCINKYVNGRMSQEEMLSTNRATLRALAREQHQARLLRRQSSRPGETKPQPMTIGKKLGRGMSLRGRSTFMRLLQEKRSSSFAFSELVVQRPALSQLVYTFCIDNALVAYAPASGKKRIQQLSGRVEASGPLSSEEKGELSVAVHLMADEAESVSFTVSPNATLDAILRQLYTHRDGQSRREAATTDTYQLPLSPLSSSPPSDTGTVKRERSNSGKPKFGSISKALQLQPRVQFQQATTSFYPLFAQWLEFFGQKDSIQPLPGSSGTDKERTHADKLNKRGHRRSKSSTAASLSAVNGSEQTNANPIAGVVPPCIYLAKRVFAAENAGGVGSSGFVPLSEMMKAPLSECFSTKEIATATSASPLRIYLYFADSAPSLSHLTSPSAGAPAASRKICFSDATLAYLASLVSYPPPQNVLHKLNPKADDPIAPLPDLAHSALSELTGVFSSVLEIMPSSSQTGLAGTVPVDLPVATKSSGGFFSARLRRFTSSSSHGLPSSMRAISATPPVLLVSNSPLQIIPWELLLHDIVIRSLSLHELLHSPAMKPRKALRGEGPAATLSASAAALSFQGQQPGPRFVLAFTHVVPNAAAPTASASTVYTPTSIPLTSRGSKDKERASGSAAIEEEAASRQVEWVVGRALHGLRVWPEGSIYGSEAGFSWPHACALTATPKLVSKYRKKLRSLAFVDLTTLVAGSTTACTPAAMSEAIMGGESLVGGGMGATSEWCVCLLTYGELVDAHPLVTALARRGCTLLFVPPSHIKEAAERLAKLSDALRGPQRIRPAATPTAGLLSLPHLLLAAMAGFHEEFLLPIAIINPPAPPSGPAPAHLVGK